jgi:hypothetical protein
VLVSSTQLVAKYWSPFLFFDDALLFLLVLIAMINIDFRSNYSPKKILYVLSLLAFLFFSLIYNFYSLNAFFLKTFYYAKRLFVFLFVSYLSRNYITFKSILFIYYLIIFLAALSLLEFYFINFIDNSYVKYFSFSYRFGYFRSSGLSAHPISLGVMSLLGIIIGKELLNKKFGFSTLILVLSIVASGTRFIILYIFLYGFYLLLINRSIKFNSIRYNTRPLFLACYPFLFLFLFVISTYINLKDAENLRRVALVEGAPLLLIPDNFAFGTGIGSFGGAESVKYDSPIYKEVDISDFWLNIMETRNKKVGPENFFFIGLIELGVIGLFLYFLALLPSANRKISYFFLFYVLIVTSFSFVYPLNILPYMYLINVVFPNGGKPRLVSLN